MEIHSLPSLLASIFSFALALIVGFNHRRDRLNIAFALFVSGLALFSFSSFLPQVASSLKNFNAYSKISVFLQTPIFVTAIYFILVLTGYIEKKKKKVLGISVKTYLISLFVGTILVLPAWLIPGIIIKGIKENPLRGFSH